MYFDEFLEVCSCVFTVNDFRLIFLHSFLTVFLHKIFKKKITSIRKVIF